MTPPRTIDVTITEDDARTILELDFGWHQSNVRAPGFWASPNGVACRHLANALSIALHDHAETLRKDANHADPSSS